MQSVTMKLEEIFRQVFDDDDIVLRNDMTANDVEGWDSLTHINLIFSVESEFSLKLTQTEILSLRNVGDFIELISNKAGKTA
jgi:acyl carrier protein